MVLVYFAALLMKAIVSAQRGEWESLELTDFDTNMHACQSWLDAEGNITAPIHRIRTEMKKVFQVLRSRTRRRKKKAALVSMHSHKPVLIGMGSGVLQLDQKFDPSTQFHLHLNKSRPGLEMAVRTALDDWKQRMNQYEPVNPMAVTYYPEIEVLLAPENLLPYSKLTKDAASSLLILIEKVPGSEIMRVFLEVVKGHASAIMSGFRSRQITWTDAVARAFDLRNLVNALRQADSNHSWQLTCFTELKEACLRFSFEFANDPYHGDSLHDTHYAFSVLWSSLQHEFLRQLGAQAGSRYALLSGDRVREHMAARTAEIEENMWIEMVGRG